MNKMYLTSLAVCLAIILVMANHPQYSGINYLFVPGFVLALAGIFYHVTKWTPLAYIAIAGFVVFTPIGLLGAVAVRKMLDNHKNSLFQQELHNAKDL